MIRLQQLLSARSGVEARAVRINSEQSAEREADQAAQQNKGGALRADLSRVKLHSDPEAAAVADSLGARAFTWGSHIFFGRGQLAPGNPKRHQLLDHEMAHVHQQSGVGSPSVQFAPKKTKPGIGAEPPDEAFTRMSKPGEEQGFILFEKDNATLAKGAEKTLLALLEGWTDAVQVKIHGYASKEGPDEYNLNLSAHRAVAVKRFLESHLPAGSKVVLYAHGETKFFGVRARNRRAGVWVGPAPAEKGVTPKIDIRRFRFGGTLRPLQLDLPIPPPPPVLRPVSLPPLRFTPPPRLGDEFKLDWRALAEPGALRGQHLSGRDAAAADEMGRAMYENLYRLGLKPEIASWWTNRVLQSAFDARLALENPTLLDLSESEMRKLDPNFSQKIVPLLTPDTLNWLILKTFKKDVEFRF